MYEKFYGLTERPFDLTPNPKYLFLTPSHREALSSLEYGISARTGVTVLIGEAGTGKTTLIRATLEAQGSKTKAIYMNNPTLTRQEFLEFLAQEFGLRPSVADSKTQLLVELERRLLELWQVQRTPALIIDEAQSLPYELLEEIRLLANIETTTEKLLPIVLAGQPELADRLNHTSLRQLKQRVGLRCRLKQLEPVETGAYITARIGIAGGSAATLFTREAVMTIHEQSQGIPRTISVICHNALINGFALNRRQITADLVREVCADFDFDSGAPVRARQTDTLDLTQRRKPAEPAAESPVRPTASRDMFNGLIRPRRRYPFFSGT
jgi:general secretion pathway protein A